MYGTYFEWEFYDVFVEIESYIQKERWLYRDADSYITMLLWYRRQIGERTFLDVDSEEEEEEEEEIQVVRGRTYNREQFHLIRNFTYGTFVLRRHGSRPQ